MSHPANDEWLENRRQWLVDNRCTEDEVAEDKGGEFVYVDWKKVYLPDVLQQGYEGPEQSD